jgi:ribonuclease P protein component
MNWMTLPAGQGSRLGVVTGRKIGGAVVRNRARRLLREAFRQEQHHLRTSVLLVLVARPSLAGQSLAGVRRALQRGLREAGLLADPQTSSHACVFSS